MNTARWIFGIGAFALVVVGFVMFLDLLHLQAGFA